MLYEDKRPILVISLILCVENNSRLARAIKVSYNLFNNQFLAKGQPTRIEKYRTLNERHYHSMMVNKFHRLFSRIGKAILIESHTVVVLCLFRKIFPLNNFKLAIQDIQLV